MLREQSCAPLPNIAAFYKPTLCHLHGAGNCICCGQGYIAALAARALGAKLAQLCPKDSECKKLIKKGRLVLEMQGVLYKISIMYFNPRRPTFLSMQDAGMLWGKRRIEPLFNDGWAQHRSSIQAMLNLDLSLPITCRVLFIMVLDIRVPKFVPKDYVVVEELEKHVAMTFPNDFTFWQGEEE